MEIANYMYIDLHKYFFPFNYRVGSQQLLSPWMAMQMQVVMLYCADDNHYIEEPIGRKR